MSTALNVLKNPRAGTLADQVQVSVDSPAPEAPWERMTHQEFAAWVAAQPGAVPDSVPMHKLLKAAYRLYGITLAQIEAEIAALQDAAVKYEAECDLRAPFVRRTAGLIGWLGTRLGKTSAQIDDLFRYVETID